MTAQSCPNPKPSPLNKRAAQRNANMSKNATHSEIFEGHKRLEKNVTLLAVATFVVVAIGGIVEIAPLFWIDNTIEKVEGMRPYTPLEQAGRDIYVREGCYLCHSQMIRPFRDEVERYGHYSLAAESMYDHPFQWGSKRTGPDLARVGGKYSDDWHVQHLKAPRSVVPESIMPNYSFLAKTLVNVPDPAANLTALRRVGVPYSDKDIELAATDLLAQADPEADAGDLATRYPKAQIRDYDGDPKRVTEMDALVAYLQMLGTLVDVNSAAAQEELSGEKGR
jgi:cytochrome c oxidase cbb3-type subunit II